ncbi:MAG: electron transfer flavoprotein subunit alpha/FixB family protein [Desulfobacterales bacterium]|nr:electron transfer flavoprotein subunit alpha/FixB family protein [Desulfobacterales bacterium]
MNKDIWVFIEQVQSNISGASLELLGEAVRLKSKMKNPGKIVAVIIGSQLSELIQVVSMFGAEKIYVADHRKLRLYQPDYYAAILTHLIHQEDPHILLIGATYIGSQLGPMVAIRVDTGIAAHCVELKIDDNDNLVAVVPAFGGKLLGDILCPNYRPQMASVKPGILEKPERIEVQSQIVPVDINFLSLVEPKLKPVGICCHEPKGVPLEQAEVVICGGWGVGDAEHWQMLEKIAAKLGGAVGCTRPALDEGWSQGEHTMVGTSGKSIRPNVYLGFGISGSTHHVCGMKDSKLIISVNKDEEAEIFNFSDFGLVGDIKEILPLLMQSLGIS